MYILQLHCISLMYIISVILTQNLNIPVFLDLWLVSLPGLTDTSHAPLVLLVGLVQSSPTDLDRWGGLVGNLRF